MGKFAVGDVILVGFPFSDLRNQKHRPAMVAAIAEFGDVIVCQITSNPYSAKYSVVLNNRDFQTQSLPVKSYVRPDKIFTFSEKLIAKKGAILTRPKRNEVLRSFKAFSQPPKILVRAGACTRTLLGLGFSVCTWQQKTHENSS